MRINRNMIFKVAVLLVSSFTFLAMSPSIEIKGRVVAVEGSRVKITYESDFAPSTGDEVAFGFEIPGEGVIPVEGTWKIVEVTGDYAWAEGEGAVGTLAPDYLAVILSPHPQKRSDIAAKDEQPHAKQRGKGRLGLHIGAFTPERQKELAVPLNSQGVFVVKVEKGSPADIAGIKPADVIIEFNGWQVSDPNEMKEIVVALAPGTNVEVVSIREGKKKAFLVTLGELGERSNEIPQAIWSGTWSTNFKHLVLTQTGNQVTGHYENDNGRIDGQVSGNTLKGTWSEEPSYRPPKDAGDFEFTLSSDGRSFAGRWRLGSTGDWREWKGARLDMGDSSQEQTLPESSQGADNEQMKEERRQKNLDGAEKILEGLMDFQNRMIKNKNE